MTSGLIAISLWERCCKTSAGRVILKNNMVKLLAMRESLAKDFPGQKKFRAALATSYRVLGESLINVAAARGKPSHG